MGGVQCTSSDALAVVRRRARKRAPYFVIARSHARTRPARQWLQSLAPKTCMNVISAESLMRTEPELVISGPAACFSPAVANEICVKAISCPAEKVGYAAAARSCCV